MRVLSGGIRVFWEVAMAFLGESFEDLGGY